MSIFDLLTTCVCSGTTIAENARIARIQRCADESIVVLKTDNDKFRAAFDLTGDQCSDGVFFYRRNTQSSPVYTLVFVELSGSGKKASTSVSQLRNAVKKCREFVSHIHALDAVPSRWVAVVVGNDGGTPKDRDKAIDDFRRNLKTTLKFHSGGEMDVRSHVNS